jgi:hypothetical protein
MLQRVFEDKKAEILKQKEQKDQMKDEKLGKQHVLVPYRIYRSE